MYFRTQLLFRKQDLSRTRPHKLASSIQVKGLLSKAKWVAQLVILSAMRSQVKHLAAAQ
jgi:hypothetical protein